MVNFSVYLPLADGSEGKFWFLAPAVGHRALQPASEPQMAGISMMDAAVQFIIARGSLSQCNYHSSNVCSSHRSKEKRRTFSTLDFLLMLKNICCYVCLPFTLNDQFSRVVQLVRG